MDDGEDVYEEYEEEGDENEDENGLDDGNDEGIDDADDESEGSHESEVNGTEPTYTASKMGSVQGHRGNLHSRLWCPYMFHGKC
jgi:hypothetical protein